ncbi:hypothetical protein C1645_736726 [Glomus cerebriforme]|uniref:Serine-threonine/tyrosine-protein kinase catalytic domain-containing protein n=1 Tax=Glomus cerebriforme TaxID=658196 RepID=A0A397T1B7_9GLOM|nr:hypothetical protein C1645_736726 [Glomus cerebriforme]
MWEISSRHPPFLKFENDYDLAMKTINGMRPKIVPGTPSDYKLMEQCWDANPTKRPDIYHGQKTQPKKYTYNTMKLNQYTYTTNEDEINNNSNLHSKEQDNLEIPDDKMDIKLKRRLFI